jgi:hypothetical protein
MIIRSLGEIYEGFGSYTAKRDITGEWIIVHCSKRYCNESARN